MIESEKFKKMLSILKTSSKDLNVNVCIIDYDTRVECDYEVITLYLKETNTQNGASVYKDFVIRSQLYYNEDDGRYYSALDGDIIAKSGIPTKIDILTDVLDELSKDEQITIKVRLIDADSEEPIKNQSVFMYLGGTVDEAIGSALTNKDGEASFNFYLSDPSILFKTEQLLYFEYKGNNIYRKSKSDYIVIKLDTISEESITSDVTTCITPSGDLHIVYHMYFNDMNIIDGFNDSTSLNIDENDLLAGKVLFYINSDYHGMKLIGESKLTQNNNNTVSIINTHLDDDWFNQDFSIQAIFGGNSFFLPDTAITDFVYTKTQAENIQLDMNRITNGMNIQLSFDIRTDEINESLFCEEGLDTLYYAFGEISFYLENGHGTFGTIQDGSPFYTTTNLVGTKTDSVYHFTIEADITSINAEDYAMDDFNTPLTIKAIYSGNAVCNSFEEIYLE